MNNWIIWWLIPLTIVVVFSSAQKSPIPVINMPINVLEDQVQNIQIEYGCDQMDSVDLLLPNLKESLPNILAFGGNWKVYETKRGLCRQVELVKKGRSPRLDSKHLIGGAVDFVCTDRSGNISWKCDWENLGRACHQNGLIWGGDFKNRDYGHCELPPLQTNI